VAATVEATMDAVDDATDAVIEELGELAIAQIPFRQQLEAVWLRRCLGPGAARVVSSRCVT
jgi:hypothetical protein